MTSDVDCAPDRLNLLAAVPAHEYLRARGITKGATDKLTESEPRTLQQTASGAVLVPVPLVTALNKHERCHRQRSSSYYCHRLHVYPASHSGMQDGPQELR